MESSSIDNRAHKIYELYYLWIWGHHCVLSIYTANPFNGFACSKHCIYEITQSIWKIALKSIIHNNTKDKHCSVWLVHAKRSLFDQHYIIPHINGQFRSITDHHATNYLFTNTNYNFTGFIIYLNLPLNLPEHLLNIYTMNAQTLKKYTWKAWMVLDSIVLYNSAINYL